VLGTVVSRKITRGLKLANLTSIGIQLVFLFVLDLFVRRGARLRCSGLLLGHLRMPGGVASRSTRTRFTPSLRTYGATRSANVG
jgi:hypothetical protein